MVMTEPLENAVPFVIGYGVVVSLPLMLFLARTLGLRVVIEPTRVGKQVWPWNPKWLDVSGLGMVVQRAGNDKAGGASLWWLFYPARDAGRPVNWPFMGLVSLKPKKAVLDAIRRIRPDLFAEAIPGALSRPFLGLGPERATFRPSVARFGVPGSVIVGATVWLAGAMFTGSGWFAWSGFAVAPVAILGASWAIYRRSRFTVALDSSGIQVRDLGAETSHRWADVELVLVPPAHVVLAGWWANQVTWALVRATPRTGRSRVPGPHRWREGDLVLADMADRLGERRCRELFLALRHRLPVATVAGHPDDVA